MAPKRFLFAMLLAAAAPPATASFFQDYLVDPGDGMLDASRYLSEVPMGFLPVPTIISEPAVGYGLGIGALFFHESEEQRNQRTDAGVLLPENISVAGLGATENGTWVAALGHMGFWREDSLRYRGLVAYGSVFLEFYSLPGVGELPRPVELKMDGPFVFQDLKWRIPGSSVFVGARQLYGSIETRLASSDETALLTPQASEYAVDAFNNSTTTSGIGALVEFDSRDNPFNPQTGYYYFVNYTVFDGSIGSDVDYQSFEFTGLNYWPLGDRFNFGLRLEVDGVNSDEEARLPPYVPPYIKLRGVPASRYQGNRVAVAEIQLDYRIDERWKVGVFTGTGRAADSFSALSDAEAINSYGAGFRYLIARRYGFAMGLDVARSKVDTAVYIQAGSNW